MNVVGVKGFSNRERIAIAGLEWNRDLPGRKALSFASGAIQTLRDYVELGHGNREQRL